MHKFLILGTVIAALAIGAVTPARAGEGEFYGTLAGASFGGLIGNQFGHGSGRVATTTVGVLAGGLIGNNIGHSFDQPAPTSYWNYAEPGPITYSAAYVPNYVAPPAPPPSPPPIYIDADYGSYCREYSQTVHSGDQTQETYGTACLQSDGSWRAVH